MESRINQKIDTYIQEFKTNVITLVRDENLQQGSMEKIIH